MSFVKNKLMLKTITSMRDAGFMVTEQVQAIKNVSVYVSQLRRVGREHFVTMALRTTDFIVFELLREVYMWTEKDDLFVIRAEKKKKQTSSLYNEIYQLVGFYSVFQGVLLTAVAQSNLLTCHNWWTTVFS
ncbi:uncharacterized protein [Physcomitrium patens]